MFQKDDQCRVFGVTAVENLFLTEYMPAAEGDYIKVYLSGLYHSQHAPEGFGLPQLAAELSMTESQVEAALRYWERRRLLARISDSPPVYRFHHLGQRMLTGQDSPAEDRDYIAFAESVYALFEGKRKIRPSEIAIAHEWTLELGLPGEAVLMLLNHCLHTRGSSFSFKSAQTLAVSMAEENVRTGEEAEAFLSQSKQAYEGARAVLKRFNFRRLPTQDEVSLYRVWTEQWQFSQEAVLAACSETVKASNPSFAYLGAVLEGIRRRGGAHTKAQVDDRLSLESEDFACAKEVLRLLGARISPTAVAGACATLRQSHAQPLIFLAAGEVSRRGGLFQDIEPLLVAWKEGGLRTAEEVNALIARERSQDELLIKVFDACGQHGRPGSKDRQVLSAWLDEGHSPALILAAAVQARSSRLKMPYITKVLASWKESGISTPEQAAGPNGRGTAPPSRRVKAQQYTQRAYTEEELASHAVDLVEEARKYDGQ